MRRAQILLIVGLMLAGLLALEQPVRAQGVSAVVDLDESGLIDPEDVFLFASVWRQGAPSSRVFDIAEFFPITPGNYWHFTGQLAGNTEDDFSWTVEDTLTPVKGPPMAFRIRNDSDIEGALRDGDVDLWRYAPNGDLFFHGFEEAEGIVVGFTTMVPPQIFLLDTPILFGKAGGRVGDVFEGTSTLQIDAVQDSNPVVLDATVTTNVAYSAFLPTLETVLGEFTIVLRVLLDINLEVNLGGGSEIEFNFINNTVFFKEGIGPVAIDLDPDIGNLDLQTIDEGTIVIEGTPTPITASKSVP